jgi:hypothetical protein
MTSASWYDGSRRVSKGRGHNYITQGSEVQKWADHLKSTGNTAFAYGVTGQPMNRFALQEDTPPDPEQTLRQ